METNFFTKVMPLTAWRGAKQIFALAVLFFLVGVQVTVAQYKERVYATAPSVPADISPTQSLIITLSEVTNPNNARNGNVKDASTLFTTIGTLSLIQAYQNVRFPAGDLPPDGNTPVTVKVATGASILNVLGGLEVQATLNGTLVGTKVDQSNLISLLGGGVLSNGLNVFEITFVPGANYNGVRVRVSPTLGVGVSANYFHAYFLKDATAPIDCDSPIDALYGASGVATLLASVSNPYNVLTQTLPETQLNTGVAVAANLYETVVFAGARPGSAQVTLSIPPSILALEVFDNIEVTLMNGAAELNSASLSSLLNIDLLGLFNNGEPVVFNVPASGEFDRVKISTNAIGGVLSSLKIHSVKRLLPAPVVAESTVTIYNGQSTTLQATSLNASDELHWYEADGVTPLASTTVSPTVTTSYKVAASLSGCADQSAQETVTVNVLELATISPEMAVIELVYDGDTPLASSDDRTLEFTTAGLLPDGLTLELDGTISGTPTASAVNQTFMVDITDVTDGGNIFVGTYSFTITVKLEFANGSFPTALSSGPYSQTWDGGGDTRGGGGAYTYSATDPNARMSIEGMPPGFTFSGNNLTGIVTGDMAGETFTDIPLFATDGDQSASAFFTFSVDGSLPVKLADFTVSGEGRAAVLNWTTTEEVNTSYFEIEHSADAVVWRPLGTRQSLGEGVASRNYSFTHATPVKGTNYYRLKVVDADGTFERSSIRSIVFGSEANLLTVYPNPVSDFLTLDEAGLEQISRIELINGLGQVVYRSGTQVEGAINVRNLAAGLYLARITDVNGVVATQKVVVNR